jgi:hypothetical protein
LRFPPLPEIPEPLRGGAFVSIDVTHLGTAEEALALLEPFLTLPACWFNTLGTVPLAELGAIVAEPVDPMPASEMSGLLRDFDGAAIDRLLNVVGARSTTPLVVVQVRHLGGALARASATEGPAGAVLEPYQFFCLGVPVGPEAEAAIEASFADVREALAGHSTGRTMFTFLGADDDPGRAFSPAALARLRELKRRTDPDGVIRSNRPVLPRG